MSRALWSSVVPIPPLLALTTVAQGDLVRPVQLRSTVELHHQRRVLDAAGNNRVGRPSSAPLGRLVTTVMLTTAAAVSSRNAVQNAVCQVVAARPGAPPTTPIPAPATAARSGIAEAARLHATVGRQATGHYIEPIPPRALPATNQEVVFTIRLHGTGGRSAPWRNRLGTVVLQVAPDETRCPCAAHPTEVADDGDPCDVGPST